MMKQFHFIGYIILIILLAVVRSQEEPELVHSKSGIIRGILAKSLNNETVSVYYGIPYAEPPIGKLRFSSPRKVKPWASPLHTTEPPLSCYQQFTEDFLKAKGSAALTNRPWSENCLKMNVFAPFPKPAKSPVVVFIHGGAFLVGSSLSWVDLTTLASEDIVVAAINYRLGVFGFLSLGNDQVPGNAGLMDQQLAMEWVKENIEGFGGDPESVTLMGSSAGSASVGFHLLAPGSGGLFQRAMMISGVPANVRATLEMEDVIIKTKSLIKDMGCSSNNDISSLECLQGKDPEDILNATLQPNVFLSEHFLPIVDGRFLTEHPAVSTVSGRFNKADVLIGSVSDDAAGIMKDSLSPRFFSTEDGRLFRKDFKRVIQMSQKGLSDLQAEVLNVVYTNWTNPDDPLLLRDAAKDAFTDGMYVCGINDFAESLYKSGNRVFRYVFDHKMSFAASLPGTQWMRATHGFDLIILVGQAAMRFGETPQDKKVRQMMLESVVQFIRTG